MRNDDAPSKCGPMNAPGCSPVTLVAYFPTQVGVLWKGGVGWIHREQSWVSVERAVAGMSMPIHGYLANYNKATSRIHRLVGLSLFQKILPPAFRICLGTGWNKKQLITCMAKWVIRQLTETLPLTILVSFLIKSVQTWVILYLTMSLY